MRYAVTVEGTPAHEWRVQTTLRDPRGEPVLVKLADTPVVFGDDAKVHGMERYLGRVHAGAAACFAWVMKMRDDLLTQCPLNVTADAALRFVAGVRVGVPPSVRRGVEMTGAAMHRIEFAMSIGPAGCAWTRVLSSDARPGFGPRRITRDPQPARPIVAVGGRFTRSEDNGTSQKKDE